MRGQGALGLGLAVVLGLTTGASGSEGDEPSADRGRAILTEPGGLPPAWRDLKGPWGDSAYRKAGTLWGRDAPDPADDPEGYAEAFRNRYGLHPAPFPNDGLPMGLRLTRDADGSPDGRLTVDCLLCHGGSIGGTSYVGLGNSQLDAEAFFHDMAAADGQRTLPAPFVVNTARGTVNAGQMAIVLWSFRNSDLSFRKFPLLLGANFPEVDTPAWWLLKKKSTKYYDGRTVADDHRSNMQFHLGQWTLEQFRATEDAFKDLQAYIETLEAPPYPFPIDRALADRGRAVFENTCSKCHGTYGPDGVYPNRIVPLAEIGTDPVRAEAASLVSVRHYNASWFGEEYQVDEAMTGYQAPPLDGVWATAPYLHNGSVPTLYHLLRSSDRPGRFTRPPSTSFDHYDTTRVGWKFDVVTSDPPPDLPRPEAYRVVDTTRRGLGNAGHTFGDALSEEERMAVIEYLKTL